MGRTSHSIGYFAIYLGISPSNFLYAFSHRMHRGWRFIFGAMNVESVRAIFLHPNFHNHKGVEMGRN